MNWDSRVCSRGLAGINPLYERAAKALSFPAARFNALFFKLNGIDWSRIEDRSSAASIPAVSVSGARNSEIPMQHGNACTRHDRADVRPDGRCPHCRRAAGRRYAQSCRDARKRLAAIEALIA